MKTIHNINTNDFITNHILKDGATVIYNPLEVDSYWTVCVVDNGHKFYLSQPLIDDDCMIPMLFKSLSDALNYINNSVDNYLGAL